MLFDRCPFRETLHDFAIRPNSAQIAAHVSRCATCQEYVAELRANEELIAELRSAAESVDDETRRHIVDLCQLILRENPGSGPNNLPNSSD
jgi:anti-sigma factor RsiW